MPRKQRIEFNGAIYHIFQRGNNKEHIFKEDVEKGFFLKQIKECMIAYNFSLFAYVIMDNHYHLIIQTKETPIHKIMYTINNTYRISYNKNHDRTGHVFEERYNSKLITEDAYLIWLLRYIHRNSVRAHICSELFNYKWSSDYFYRKNVKSFVNIDFILNMLSSNRYNAIKTYLQILNEPEKSESDDYEYIKGKLANLNLNVKHTACDGNRDFIRKSLQEILASLNLSEGDSIAIRSGSRKRHLTPYKVKFITIAMQYKYTFSEIAEFIGVSPSGISRLMEENG